MPEIQIRPAIAADLPILAGLDHHGVTESVWQMDVRPQHELTLEIDPVQVAFRPVRLPRPVPLEYPRNPHWLLQAWEEHCEVLVALLLERPIGYVGLQVLPLFPALTWVTDLVVDRPWRRQGVGAALLLAALEWAAAAPLQPPGMPAVQDTGKTNVHSLAFIIPARNYPAIRLAEKLGFDFCGYNDRIFTAHEIGLFFAKTLH